MFSFPVTKLWGAPSSRFLRGRVRCSLYHGVCRAQGPGSHLRRALPALFYLLVLSAIAISRHCAKPRCLRYDAGTDPRALSVRGHGLCCDARAYSPASDGTRSRHSSNVMQVVKQRTARALLAKRKRNNPRQRNLFGDEPKQSTRRNGAPTLLMTVARSKAWATRQKRKDGAPTVISPAAQRPVHPPTSFRQNLRGLLGHRLGRPCA